MTALRFRDLPIQRKLVALVLVASAIALALASAAVVLYEVTTVRPRVMRDLQTQADLLRANTTAALSFGDARAAAENLATLAAKPEIEAAALYDASRARFAGWRRSATSHIAPPARAPAAGGVDDGAHLLFTTPILSEDETLGHLAIWYELPPLRYRLPQYGIMAGVVLAALLTVGLLLAALLRSALTGPLADLARTARAVTTTQRYDARAAKHGDDEVGALTDAVNAMLGTIEARDQALRRNTAQLRGVMAAARMTSWSWDPAADRVTWGEEAGPLLGAGDALRGGRLEDFLALVHPEDRAKVSAALRGARGAAVFRVPGAGRDERSFELQVWAGAGEETGTGPRRIGLVQDVTERERTEEARRTWADAFEHASLGIALSDPATGRLRYANPAFAALYGRAPEELPGLPVRAFYAPSAWEAAQDRIAAADAAGHATFESVHVRADGSEFPVEVTLTTVQDLDGRPRYRIANVQDLTEQHRLEEQFRQAQKMEAIGRLAGGIAHDFNNLLTVITGYSGFATRRLGPEHPVTADLREVQKAADRAAALTQQLLAYSRRQVLQPRVLEPNLVLTDLSRMLTRLLGETIELGLRLAPDAGRIRADRTSLEQVIVNLAVNARDAMPEGGRLTLETRNVTLDAAYAASHPDVVPGRYLLIAVSDTGHGMDDATRARIFEPFFTTKPFGQGTGLGLAMVYGTVQQSGGHIEVRSAPNEGATFRIYLPLHEEDAALDGAPAPDPAAPRGTETVLVVEDEEGVLSLAARTLGDLGYRVLAASTPEQAIALAEAHRGELDLLLADVVMPRLNGREVAGAVERVRPGLPVLFMSGYTDDAVVAAGVVEATAAFLQKPFTPEALARKVRAVLDGAPSAAR